MTIETERLLLRPFQEGDAEDVFEYLNEPAVNCFAGMKLHSLEEAREEVIKRSYETEYYFAIVLKVSNDVNACEFMLCFIAEFNCGQII